MTHAKTPPRAVIFDCDGVLVDSEAITNVILAANLTRHGLPTTPADCMEFYVGGTIRGVGEQARAMGAVLPATWVDDIYAEIYARLAQDTPLVAGVESVLDALDGAGIPYAVGSNGSDRKMQITLGQHPALMARLAGRLYSGQTLGCAKPDPGLFLHAARALGVAPGDCAVIEDSVPGCTAAARAGMTCFGYAEHDDGVRLAVTGATVFHHMSDLPRLLGL